MNAAISSAVTEGLGKQQINANDFATILNHYADKINVLSLDCFDTLLWRKTAAPKDIFNYLQQRPLFQSLGITAYQRINAAAQAYRLKFHAHGHREIKLREIYQHFTALSEPQKAALVEEELMAEMEMCYPFLPVVQLIKQAKDLGKKVVIVSDTYFDQSQLRKLLTHTLPADVIACIDAIFCSSEFNKSKSTGLFENVLSQLSESANAILHIGDHKVADYDSPKKLGIHALHFLQFEPKITEFMRMQHISSALTIFSDPQAKSLHLPRYSPFRGIFSKLNAQALEKPEVQIGYMTFGPIFYAFANFVQTELNILRQQGKRVKAFFLMRDGLLLSKACEAFTGGSLGKCVYLRKFGAVAASFKTKEDIDYYLSGIAPQHFNFYVICEQLLLPKELTEQIIQISYSNPNPEKTFNELIHREEIMNVIFNFSSEYRERLKRYIQKDMQLESGDTAVLIDVGYIGVTQKHLTRALEKELGVDFFGLYLIASHEPDRPESKSLITSTLCDHGLFEQSCTYREGSVSGYDQEGNPIFDEIKLTDAQYKKISAIQNECIRFIYDAKQFVDETQLRLPAQMLQETALASLRRHVYLPLEAEIEYYKVFQHDKDMGADKQKKMFNISHSRNALKQSLTHFHFHPYEMRSANLSLTLSSMVNNAFNLELLPQDMSFNYEAIRLIVVRDQATSEVELKAYQTHDGYYSLFIPNLNPAQIGIWFGQLYRWIQIETVQIMGQTKKTAQEIHQHFSFNQIKNRSENLFECESENGVLVLQPIADPGIQGFQVIFRPIVRLNK